MNCRVEVPVEQKYERPELTVGREFYVQCDGDFKNVRGDEPLTMVQPPPTDPFSLKILGVHKKNDQQLDLLVTSYVTGQLQIPGFTIRLGETELKSETPLSFEVVSLVQEQEQKGVQVEPFGPFGPFSVNISFFFYLGIAVWALLVLSGFVVIFLQSRRRKWYLTQTPFQASIKPLIEFEKVIRTFQNVNEEKIIEQTRILNQCWRVYWTRRFAFPAMFWSERRLLNELKRDHRSFYEKNKKLCDHFIGEMRKIRTGELKPQMNEFDKLVRETRIFIEKVDEYLEKDVRSLRGVSS